MKTRKIPRLKKGQKYSFYGNPFYDEILVFLDRVPSSQEKYKMSSTNPGFYEKYDKNNVTEFCESIRKRLIIKKKAWWPFTGCLLAVVNISGAKKNIDHLDLDNLLKTIFDSLKGVVFKDDSQITTVIAEKELMPEATGFCVGLKMIKPYEHLEFLPSLFSGGNNFWEEESLKKEQTGGILSFDVY
ncbi:RusA family crossover junction endodeoxyribonuclease [Marivirga sp.]|uniref:RusA family crossover junction endodeoxyribonuclease n=1 Tax=Marivirga sp. TaxID=2018662 RepID=UPI003DA74005